MRSGGVSGAFFVLTSVLVAGACGSSDGDESGLAFDAIPEAYASAACSAFTACLGSLTDTFLNGQPCEESTLRTVTDQLEGIEPGIESGRIRYDGNKMAACLDALEAAGCNYDEIGASPVCLAAIDGTVKLGDDCDYNTECEGTAYCRSSGSCPGKCAAAQTEGGTCTSDTDCDPELECDEDKRECYAPGAAGDRCGGGTEPGCGAGLLCLGASEDDGTPGTCRLLTEVLSASEGAPCNPALGPLCGEDLYCAILAVTPTIRAECRAGVGAGASCAVGFPDPCNDDEYCKAPQGSLTGTCTDRPGAGNACAAGPFGDPPDICAPGTVCDGGTCRSRQNLGGTCAANGVCLSDNCVDGRCALDGACE
jgi:hypothetical protein